MNLASSGKVRAYREGEIPEMAMPMNQVKKETMTQPHTRLANPTYWRMLPYNNVIPVKIVIVEKVIANFLSSVCRTCNKRSPSLEKPEKYDWQNKTQFASWSCTIASSFYRRRK